MSEHPINEHVLERRLIDRMLFFSDAVFAIVLTLLVLEIRPPETNNEADILSGLADISVHFVAFVVSFAIGGVFWLSHMRITRSLQHFDWPTATVNLIHLLTVALSPFISALLGEHIGSPLAFEVYSAVVVMVSFTSTALWLTASRDKGRLIGGTTARNRWGVVIRTSAIGWCFIGSIVLTELGRVNEARFAWVLVAPLMMIARLVSGGKPKLPAAANAA